ncbi:MAG TPA: LLM class flavin-dependent oxidoreductase, partial [Candidatus Sulfotelmatobacter sp.]|nr:LLM class flavin-dependent oxidoreductase [Candidatus Sulfotelmatobacter sp.]
MNHGRQLEFGVFLTPSAADPARTLELAVLADELGYDLVGVQDHPYQRRFLDTWTLLTAIAMRTSRVTVFPDVANLPLRPPAVLAKAAATLDLLSGGRLELGLGAGGAWDAIRAIGGPVRTPADSVSALE